MSIDRREFIPVIRNAYVIRNPERRDGREGKAQLLPFHAANVLLQKEDVAMIAFDGEEA